MLKRMDEPSVEGLLRMAAKSTLEVGSTTRVACLDDDPLRCTWRMENASRNMCTVVWRMVCGRCRKVEVGGVARREMRMS